MCGIFGALGPKHSLLQGYSSRIHQRLNHRGPDDFGLEKDENFTLGFNRLAILDLSVQGHQPMYDASGRYVIVFNGEIYNYKELRSSELFGVKFSSETDTEVLLYLLIKEGAEALNKLNGMFAFCFVDIHTGSIIMGRDRFGIKPLYFTVQENTLFFTSELQGLRFIDELDWQLDESALMEYIGIGYISHDRSIYRQWSKLLPGHYISFNFKNVHSQLELLRYWKLSFDNLYERNYEEALEEFEELFSDAVAIRLRSDVPVGIFLSGGIDSGLVAAFAQRVRPVDCYTIAYKEKDFDESELSALTAKHIGAKHEIVYLDNVEMEHLDVLGQHFDEPFSDSSALPSYKVCKAGAKKATVFLTGDAGDEAFAGYNRYIKRLRHQSIIKKLSFLRYLKPLEDFIPLKHAIKFHKLTSDPALRDNHYDQIPGNPWQTSLFQKKYKTYFRNSFKGFIYCNGDVTRNQQMFDYEHYLPNDILVKMDRASMANSIEVRSPFLDYRLHEFAARLPREWLIDEGQGKKILRDISRKHLPEVVFNARKRGFGIPLADWTRNDHFLSRLEEKISSSEIASKYFDMKGIKRIISLHKKAEINGGGLLWRLSMLMNWEEINVKASAK